MEGGLFRSERLTAWDRNEKFVLAACVLLGIAVPLGHRFPCVLPGGDGHTAHLWKDDQGDWKYACSRHGSGRTVYALMEVYAAVISGQLVDRAGPELARWKLRLLLDTGTVKAPTVALPPLPPEATERHRQLYAGVRRVFEARWLADPGEPAPLARRFLGDWCHMSPSAVQKLKGDLISWEIIVKAGRHGRATLWLPGQMPREIPEIDLF
jgi:hypothetical protein